MASPQPPNPPVASDPAHLSLFPLQFLVTFSIHLPHLLIPPAPPVTRLTSEERQHLAEEAQLTLESLAPVRSIEGLQITGVDKWFS